MNNKYFSCLAWNVCGFGNRKSQSHMRDLLQRYKLDIFIFETYVHFKNIKYFWD